MKTDILDNEKVVKKERKSIFRVISDFFYDVSVKLHNIFKKEENKKSTLKDQRKKKLRFYTLLLIFPVIQFLIFYVFVNFNSILLAFQEFNQDTANFDFLQIDQLFANFIKVVDDLFNNKEMQMATSNSFKIYFCSLLIGTPLNLIFAFLMYKKIPGHGAFRIVLFLPQIISSLIISLMFKYFVEVGATEIIKALTGETVHLLTDRDTGFSTIMFYCIWASFGSQIIIYTNAFSQISPELIEYGKLEGINLWQEFFLVALPLIFPTITIYLVAGVAGIFTNQAALFNFFGPGANPDVQTLGYIFFVKVLKSETAAYAMYPYASAAGLLFTAVATPLTLLIKWALEKFGPRED